MPAFITDIIPELAAWILAGLIPGLVCAALTGVPYAKSAAASAGKRKFAADKNLFEKTEKK
jgi:hypothetical protein